MPEFTIRETVYMTIEAPTPQDALDTWLNVGNEAITSFSVEDRDVLDSSGERCDVEEP